MIVFRDLSTSNGASAVSYDGGSWSFMGPRGFSGGAVKMCAITTHDNMPYVLYNEDGSDEATVKYYNVSVISVDEELGTARTILYPNPSSGIIHVKGLENSTQVEVLDIHGRKVWTGSFGLDRDLDLGELPNGFYILRAGEKSLKFQILH